jgi:hypothetical protein
MSGRLGMEIQPKNMTDEEKALCRKAISEYKEIRPVVQFGDLYRLVSPYDNQGLSSIMYVSEAKDKAVFYWWKLANFYNAHLPIAICRRRAVADLVVDRVDRDGLHLNQDIVSCSDRPRQIDVDQRGIRGDGSRNLVTNGFHKCLQLA